MTGKKRILITGSTGYVGKRLILQLLSKDYEVIAISSNVKKAGTLFPGNVKLFDWESLDKLAVSYDKIDIVIHLAGANIGKRRWTGSYREKLVESRVRTTGKLSGALLKMKEKPSLWIQASAIGYYGADNVQVLNEKGENGNGFLSDLAERWENSAKPLSEEDIPIVLLRLGVIVHPSGPFLKPFLRLRKLGLLIAVGNGKNHLSWIHIQDLLNLIEYTITSNKYLIINAVSPNPVQMNTLYKILRRAFKLPVTIRIPAFLIKRVMGREKTNELVMADQRIGSGYLEDSDFKFSYPSFSEIFNLEGKR